MKYYLGESLSRSFYTQILTEVSTGCVLFSFASHSRLSETIEVIRQLTDQEIMIDSGAFSVWNSGKTIDFRSLKAFYKELNAFRSGMVYINLDVIPGKLGMKPTAEQAQKACADSWNNYLALQDLGIRILPVFHEDDEWKYLKMIKESTDYFAISPANDSHTKKRMRWLDAVYSEIKADYKTHSLAGASPTLLKRYPFYSVDSVNWKNVTMYGMSKIKGTDKMVSAMARDTKARLTILKHEVQYYKDLQSFITRLWERRGVQWQ